MVNPVASQTTEAPTAEPRGDRATAIELIDVRKDFRTADGTVAAVDGVSAAIREGDFFSMLGPSGCGKTTTLRMIGGFDEPTAGRILLQGENVVGIPANRRDVNMVFQSYALFPNMSVQDNIAFGLRRRRVDPDEVRRRVGEMLELVELTGREKRRPSSLSGGQQQRVALARALVNRPRALLLDEPLAALDLKLRQAMQVELKRIQREVGVTFVYVTHDQTEALTMSDRLIVMNEGRIAQHGTPEELYERPGNRFVADFIGVSNILSATVERAGGSTASARVGDQSLPLPALDGHSPGSQVELVVRPEKITVCLEPPQADVRLRATVRDVAYLGTSTNATMRLSTGEELVAFVPNVEGNRWMRSAAPGTELWLTWTPESTYVLPGTGR
jgi:spermidine/putrescine transport system ATP-binding protein